MHTSRRQFLTIGAAATALALLPAQQALASSGTHTSAFGTTATTPAAARLTNLAHLRFLLAEVPVTATAEHTTYAIDTEPTVLAPWTYADNDGAGGYRRVGGGTLDPVTRHWTQGAYNADDITRTSIVFLREWQATGDEQARDEARGLLRSVAYLQTVSGPNSGRVILWQQEDGTLTPSAIPVELPDPSDSAESYWLARTVWALGEGYAAFRGVDDDFANFLHDRLHLCLDALERESLSRAGQFVLSDGVQVPAWLIAGGADATAEAVLGLTAAHEADTADDRVTRALTTYADGIAAMSTRETQGWPFGAVLPWAGSTGFWHAWGAAAPEALARAGQSLGRSEWTRAAVADAGRFTPLLLACGGPNNAWAPLPAEAQIAYGVHGRVAAALQSSHSGGEGLRLIAALAAGWFFGANNAGIVAYDRAKGTTVDGIETDGRVNPNSGAESTIHALLTMQLLDTNPDVARLATSLTAIRSHRGLTTLDAEGARLSPGCTVVAPETGAWIGEGNLSGGSYVEVPAGEWVEFDVSEAGGVLHALLWRYPEDAGDAVWEFASANGTVRVATPAGGVGARGLTEADGSLVPQFIAEGLPAGTTTVRCTSTGKLRLDALLVQPAVSTAVYATAAGDVALYVNGTSGDIRATALSRGAGRSYDDTGKQHGQAARSGAVRVRGGGFTVTR